jgi:hypothetical protein
MPELMLLLMVNGHWLLSNMPAQFDLKPAAYFAPNVQSSNSYVHHHYYPQLIFYSQSAY